MDDDEKLTFSDDSVSQRGVEGESFALYTSDDGECVCKALIRDPMVRLRVFELHYVQIEASQLHELVMALGQNTTIVWLTLSGLHVPRDAESVIEWIVRIPLINHTIRIFKATHLAGFTDEHVRILADAVRHNHALHTVDISSNHELTVAAKISFIASLAHHPSMRAFFCKSWGSITGAEARDLYAAVAETPLIEVLLHYNFKLNGMHISHAYRSVEHRAAYSHLLKATNHIDKNATKFLRVRPEEGAETYTRSPDTKVLVLSAFFYLQSPERPCPHGKRIEEITVYHADLTDSVLALILGQRKLKRLVLTACGIGGDIPAGKKK